MVKALIRVSKTLAAVSAILVILASLLACGEQITDPRSGGGDGTGPRGRLNIIAKSGDARG